MTRWIVTPVVLVLLASSCGASSAEVGPGSPPTSVQGDPPTPDPPVDPAIPEPQVTLSVVYLDEVVVEVDGDDARVIVRGNVPTPCHEPAIEVTGPDAGGVVRMDVWSSAPVDAVCIQVLAPFELVHPLGILAPGSYVVEAGREEVARFDVPDHRAGDESPAALFPGIFPATSMEEYARLADETAAGHMPWALDPLLVAERHLTDLYGAALELDFVASGEQHGEVVWHDGRAVVWRDGGEGRPWVVTAVEAGSLHVSIGDYHGRHVPVAVSTDRDGEVTVAVGVFASEWSATETVRIAARELREWELVVAGPAGGPGPEVLLVDIRFRADSGEVAIAQHRVVRTGAPAVGG